MTTRHARITETLQAAFAPDMLEVIDDSARHAGHAGARGLDGETHFEVRIAARGFAGLSRVAVHRQINDALASEFSTGLHALSIKIVAQPD